MTLFRTVDGAIAWFDNAGAPIHPDGSPRPGPTLDALGGPDGTEPPGFTNPGASPTPAPARGPVLQPSTFANLNVYVTDAATHAPLPGATVLISPDFGNGTSRTTDGAGFANFGVGVGYDVEINILAPDHANNDHVVHIFDASDHAYAIALVPTTSAVGAAPGPGQPPGVPSVVILDGSRGIVPLDDPQYHFSDVPPAPAFARVALETRGGVPAFTAESFGALDIAGFGPSPSGILTTIVGGLIGLFKGSAGGADISKLSFLVNNLGNFALHLAETLADFTARSVHTDGQTGGLFDRILGGVLGPIINALAAVIRGGSSDLGKLFGPISDSLKKIISTVRHLYDTWLRPIIKAIDTTRQILRILESFHLKWAAEADAALGRLEGKLSAPVLLAIRKLNEVSNVVNRIVTLDGALQRVTLIKGLTKHATCVQRAIDQAPMAPAGSYSSRLTQPDLSTVLPSVVDAASQFAENRGGPWADDYADWLQNVGPEVSA